jgi:cell division protein FtsQ
MATTKIPIVMSTQFFSKKQMRQLGWTVGLFLGGLLIISAVEQKSGSLVQGIKVDIEPLPGGNLMIKPEDVLSTVGHSFGFHLEGLPIKAIEVQRLEKVLEEDPLIKDANVYMDSRNFVRIGIEQREPVLRVIDRNGLNYYLDKDGVKMPLSKHLTARVLVATGNIPPHVPDFLERKHNVIKDLFALSNDLRNDEFLHAQIEQVYVSSNKEFVLVPMVGDQKIIFGHYEDALDKFQNLKIFYKEGLPYEGWRKYRRIDLRYRGQVVCK